MTRRKKAASYLPVFLLTSLPFCDLLLTKGDDQPGELPESYSQFADGHRTVPRKDLHFKLELACTQTFG